MRRGWLSFSDYLLSWAQQVCLPLIQFSCQNRAKAGNNFSLKNCALIKSTFALRLIVIQLIIFKNLFSLSCYIWSCSKKAMLLDAIMSLEYANLVVFGAGICSFIGCNLVYDKLSSNIHNMCLTTLSLGANLALS